MGSARSEDGRTGGPGDLNIEKRPARQDKWVTLSPHTERLALTGTFDLASDPLDRGDISDFFRKPAERCPLSESFYDC